MTSVGPFPLTLSSNGAKLYLVDSSAAAIITATYTAATPPTITNVTNGTTQTINARPGINVIYNDANQTTWQTMMVFNANPTPAPVYIWVNDGNPVSGISTNPLTQSTDDYQALVSGTTATFWVDFIQATSTTGVIVTMGAGSTPGVTPILNFTLPLSVPLDFSTGYLSIDQPTYFTAGTTTYNNPPVCTMAIYSPPVIPITPTTVKWGLITGGVILLLIIVVVAGLGIKKMQDKKKKGSKKAKNPVTPAEIYY